MRVESQQLKSFLLDSELISETDLEKAEEVSVEEEKPLKEILLKQKKISEDDLARLEAYILGIPFINLEHEKINPAVLQIIPEPIARNHNIVAFREEKNKLEVAMIDPEDLETIEFIKKKAGLKILPRLTNRASIQHILKQYQKSLEAEFGSIIKKESDKLPIKIKKDGQEGQKENEDLSKLAQDLPVIKIVDTMLKHAILQRASDIHIEPAEKEVLVRYRIDGILHDAMTLPKQVSQGIVARIKVLSNLKLDEHRLPQDGRFRIETESEKVSFRVSVLPVFDGEKTVMRLLPENVKGFTLESLGFHGDGLERIHKAIRKPVGMVLATGPTGSGKTTTLYTILDILNVPGVNISTIEDPIEYRIPRVNQTQVKPEIGFTFANGLRSLVRQDPDIIMVGEIRDKETASLAVNAALTGHLVLSTLHTNSAAGALPRLFDMGVEPFLIASTINVIIAQRLVRRLCPGKEAGTLSKEGLGKLFRDIDTKTLLGILINEKAVDKKASWDSIKFYKPKTSKDCEDGYQDRIGVHEVLQVTEGISRLLMSNATADDIEKQAIKEGMITMFEDGVIKAVQGITSIEEILRVTSE